MQGRKQAVLQHLQAKINWLKTSFGDWNNGTYSEPARDTTPAAELPEYVSSGVENVVIEAPAQEGSDTYYDLLGRPVANPATGIYVRNNTLIYMK